MARLMSVSLTEPQVVARTKDVTRRMGWLNLKAGDRLTLCRKVMGRKKGEPLVRIVDVQVVSVRREPLNTITAEDVAREGFPHMTPAEFVRFFCDSHKGCRPDSVVTRIEWRYLDAARPVNHDDTRCALCDHLGIQHNLPERGGPASTSNPTTDSPAGDGSATAQVSNYHPTKTRRTPDMSDLTPERIRDAAEVLEALTDGPASVAPQYISWSPSVLRKRADRLEREQAAKAKREQRIDELAHEVFAAHYGVSAQTAAANWGNANADTWRRVARALIDRYPALAEVSTDE